MDIKQIVMLAIQVSILCTVFGFGLKATTEDLLYLVRRPSLLGRSLLAMFVIMPVVAVVLTQMFDFRPTVEIALLALAISPVPPLLLKRETIAGGYVSFGLGLMAILGLLSIAAVPASLWLLEHVYGRELAMAPSTVAGLVLKSVLLPLGAGMALRAALPKIAERLEKLVALVGMLLLLPAALLLLFSVLPAIWALIGDGTVLGIAIFTVTGLGIGHLLGGPNPAHSVVLAFSTACRHPAIALAIAATNFPDEHFGATILLYLLVSVIVGIPYLMWQRRQLAGGVREA